MRLFREGDRAVSAVEGESVRKDFDGNAAGESVAGSAVPAGSSERVGSSRSRRATIRSSWIPQIEEAIRKSSGYFYRVQYPEGYWWAELESNVTITSEYVMLMRLLGIPLGEKHGGIVKYLLGHQDENGAWGLYLGDGGELSTTIEAYFALKLLGEDPASETSCKSEDLHPPARRNRSRPRFHENLACAL